MPTMLDILNQLADIGQQQEILYQDWLKPAVASAAAGLGPLQAEVPWDALAQTLAILLARNPHQARILKPQARLERFVGFVRQELSLNLEDQVRALLHVWIEDYLKLDDGAGADEAPDAHLEAAYEDRTSGPEPDDEGDSVFQEEYENAQFENCDDQYGYDNGSELWETPAGYAVADYPPDEEWWAALLANLELNPALAEQAEGWAEQPELFYAVSEVPAGYGVAAHYRRGMRVVVRAVLNNPQDPASGLVENAGVHGTITGFRLDECTCELADPTGTGCITGATARFTNGEPLAVVDLDNGCTGLQYWLDEIAPVSPQNNLPLKLKDRPSGR